MEDEQQQAFNAIKLALIEATALAQPDSEDEFVLNTDDSAVTISGFLHQWQVPPSEKRLRPFVYGSKTLNATQAKFGAPKLETYAVCNFKPLCQKVHSDGCQPSSSLVERIPLIRPQLVDGLGHSRCTISQ